MSGDILILYWTKNGTTGKMARAVARGVESVEGATAVLRTAAPSATEDGPPHIEMDDLRACDGLIIGSPAHFGNMAAPLKQIFDDTTALWLSGALCGKPAGVFTSVGSLHGGHETTLLSMMLPLIHHGMIICSVPCTEPALQNTRDGGTPYGASHDAQNKNDDLSENEKTICQALGNRVAKVAQALTKNKP